MHVRSMHIHIYMRAESLVPIIVNYTSSELRITAQTLITAVLQAKRRPIAGRRRGGIESRNEVPRLEFSRS